MFCYNCGKKLGDKDSFCSDCGAKVKSGGVRNNNEVSNVVANGDGNKVPVQIVLPEFKGFDRALIERIVPKVFFLALAIITFMLSRDTLFKMEIKDFLSQKYSNEVMIEEVIEYVENYDELMNWNSRGYNGADVSRLHIAKWCLTISSIIYLVAAFIAFIGRESMAHVITVLGIILCIAFLVLFSTTTVEILDGEWALDIVQFFSGKMWWYLLLNIALVIISGVFFWLTDTAKVYEGKTYTLLEKSTGANTNSTSTSKTWWCDNCNKINAGYVGTCSCGKTRNW